MVKQSGFAGGTIAETYPALVYGVDYDFFQVPGVQGLQGGTDWMMAFSDSPAVQAVFAYLSSETGARRWAEVGFDITPNLAGAEGYTNESLAKRAECSTTPRPWWLTSATPSPAVSAPLSSARSQTS